MVLEHQPRSGAGGKPRLDWDAAFLHYAGLPVGERTYRAVADRFTVSIRTVERHGMAGRWKERAYALDREAAERAADVIRDRRAEALTDIGKLAQASLHGYANQLRSGRIRMSVADLPRLHKLIEELAAVQDDLAAETAPPRPPEPSDPAQHRLQVLRALNDVGVLRELFRVETGPLDRHEPGPARRAEPDAAAGREP